MPGGIKKRNTLEKKFGGYNAITGKLGGSGFWSVRSNFFQDVGYLDVKGLIGKNKQHDVQYWKLLDKSSKGKDYILGIDAKLRIHTGKIAGSVCNILVKGNMDHSEKLEKIKYESAEEKIDNMDFKTFLENIRGDKSMENDW